MSLIKKSVRNTAIALAMVITFTFLSAVAPLLVPDTLADLVGPTTVFADEPSGGTG
ncbi:MAG: hypothetical protein H6631_02905 [Anaerolineaceae bacterium]|nr:hypothetical protein [Anaerolineaceae bacterium]MCB9099643.1 hypothetical protein [Anaerolineales bacterium]